MAAEEAFIAGLNANPMEPTLGIVVREADRLIGVTGLARRTCATGTPCSASALATRRAWGKGYGTEATRLMVAHAFETLNLNRVWLTVYEYNPRGVRAYEKAGFRLEGRLRQDCFREGRYWDALFMAILREDWEKQERRVEA